MTPPTHLLWWRRRYNLGIVTVGKDNKKGMFLLSPSAYLIPDIRRPLDTLPHLTDPPVL